VPESHDSAPPDSFPLTLPGQPDDPWARIKALALDSLGSAHSRRVYGAALDEFQQWCRTSAADGFNKATIQRYRQWPVRCPLANSWRWLPSLSRLEDIGNSVTKFKGRRLVQGADGLPAMAIMRSSSSFIFASRGGEFPCLSRRKLRREGTTAAWLKVGKIVFAAKRERKLDVGLANVVSSLSGCSRMLAYHVPHGLSDSR